MYGLYIDEHVSQFFVQSSITLGTGILFLLPLSSLQVHKVEDPIGVVDIDAPAFFSLQNCIHDASFSLLSNSKGRTEKIKAGEANLKHIETLSKKERKNKQTDLKPDHQLGRK